PCGILFNTVTLKTADNKYTRMNSFSIEAGEKLNFKILADGYNDNNIESEVAAVADKTPIGETTLTDTLGAILIVAEEVYDSMLPERFNYTNVQMFINSSDPTGLIESIKEYQKHTSIANIHIYDVAASNKKNMQFVTLISVFFYGFVALIAAICVANIFNTISTSISLRKREFATLKSIGMTPKGFNKMINYESLFYGIKALLYGLPISFGIMYLIYKLLSNSFEFSFAIPWGSIIGTIIAVFAIVGSTMLYASSRIKKENIIDVLKNENI
ncbi:MAG: ABC transporter permease, partial [Desulfitobacteriaceae bacterium]|nr:ABC transporter permease [Desulfitobacteriaceae bacterium]